MFGHALWRGVLLILIAVFLSSAWSKETQWTFANVLAQIGLGYPLLFLVAFAAPRTQWAVAFGILFFYWLAFALYPLPPADFDRSALGVSADWEPLTGFAGPWGKNINLAADFDRSALGGSADWEPLTGFAGHWGKNINLAADFDVWLLNLFPRSKPFVFNGGGYQTLNFIPSLATMIFGVCAGRLLKSDLPMRDKLIRLLIAGVIGIFFGWLIARLGICPLVKRIWTPGWVLFSTGWVVLMLAGFVAVIDALGRKRWAFPLVVVGLNPITFYCLWQLSSSFIKERIRTHLGQEVFTIFGEVWAPAMERGAVLLALWLLVWWMYRQKIFVRI